jgi:ABC-2 type transport system permease protein
MNMIFYILSVAWKELQVIAKDRGALAVLFLMPLIFAAIQGGGHLVTNEEGDDPTILLDVCLVNEDSDLFGMEVAKAIEGVKELNVTVYDAVTEAEERVAQGEAAAAIVIPADFSAKIDAYTPTAVEVIVDPAQPMGASIVSGIMNRVVAEVTIWGEVQYGVRSILDESGLLADASAEVRGAVEAQSLGVIMTQLNEMRRNPAIAVVSEDLEGTQVEGGWVIPFVTRIFAGFTVMFIFFIVGTSATSLLREREEGTLRRLLAAPIPRGAVIAGKMLAYMVLACLQVVVIFGVATLFFQVSLGDSPVALVVLTFSVALVATALGMLVAALARTAKQADDIGVVLSLVLAGVGGAISLGPGTSTRVPGLANLTPHAYAVDAYYSLMAENGTLAQILPEIGILLAMAVVFYLIAVRRFRFE